MILCWAGTINRVVKMAINIATVGHMLQALSLTEPMIVMSENNLIALRRTPFG